MSELGRVQHSAWARRAEQRHSSGRDQEQGTEFQCNSWAKRCCSHAGISQLCNPRMQRGVYQTWPKSWSYKTLGQGEDEQRVSVHKLWRKAAASVLKTQRGMRQRHKWWLFIIRASFWVRLCPVLPRNDPGPVQHVAVTIPSGVFGCCPLSEWEMSLLVAGGWIR